MVNGRPAARPLAGRVRPPVLDSQLTRFDYPAPPGLALVCERQRSLREYALQHDLIVAEEFVDVETAKQSGRTAFTAMLEYLKKHRAACRTVLVEKTDRLGCAGME